MFISSFFRILFVYLLLTFIWTSQWLFLWCKLTQVYRFCDHISLSCLRKINNFNLIFPFSFLFCLFLIFPCIFIWKFSFSLFSLCDSISCLIIYYIQKYFSFKYQDNSVGYWHKLIFRLVYYFSNKRYVCAFI